MACVSLAEHDLVLAQVRLDLDRRRVERGDLEEAAVVGIVPRRGGVSA